MIKTPICDFVRQYNENKTVRGHMPGHKGKMLLGMEPFDVTEISGADSLYEASGIIRESEENASSLFGCPTFYSTEGSTQVIKAMVYLSLQWAKLQGKAPRILAGRNAHKAFVTAAALMDCPVSWLYPGEGENYLSCCPRAEDVAQLLIDEQPAALYLTSPDYLGHMADIAAIAQVCKRHNVLLIVDNAHGAYLRFLQPSLHPMDLGADLCCDSAHKTLPVLTGGAYLHLNESLAQMFPAPQVKKALSLFGSTSPSYLILQSLDAVNCLLGTDYPQQLQKAAAWTQSLQKRLKEAGFTLVSDEPMKLTILPKGYGYTGTEMADILRGENIECEFADPDHLVLMPGPMLTDAEKTRIENVLLNLPKKPPISTAPPALSRPKKAMDIRTAVMCPGETLPVEASLGRILSGVTMGCPPAVPILISGEVIDDNALRCFHYYSVTHIDVIK